MAPALGMAAIAASTLLMTESEPRWAQVFAGPTDHAGKVAWRMEVKHGTLERQLPTAAHVNFVVSFADKSRIERAVTLDDEGLAWVTFDRPATGLHEPVQVTVREGSQVLANGSVSVPERQWEGAKRLEGGWCSGHREGEREIRLGVVEGVVLHSVPAEMVVTLADAGQPLPNERFSVSADGAEIIGPRSAKASTNRVDLVTDTHGVGHFSLRSTDLAATVRVTSGSPRESSFAGALPIRAGGLYVARDANTLVITSPIGLEHATLGLLTDTGLVDVRTLSLTRTGGATSGRVSYDVLPPKPLFAMVSSEPQLDAGNTIGWPLLDPSERSEAHPSVVNPNRLVLDGYRAVVARLERQRHHAFATSNVAMLFVGTLLVWAVIRSNRQNKRQLASLDRLLAEGDSPSVAERAPYALIAIVVLTAATVGLTWWLSLGR